MHAIRFSRFAFAALVVLGASAGPFVFAPHAVAQWQGGADGSGRELIFFPASPPPLGAEVGVVAASRQSHTSTTVRAFLTEPFFSPIVTRLAQVSRRERAEGAFSTEEHVRLDSFLQIRSALLKELTDRLPDIVALPASERLAPLDALAASQQARLVEMERDAEWLRETLGRSTPWGALRSWRLNRGSLRQPREKTFVLEFQVVRAAAYYQPGLSPAQRRLVRELAIEMSEAIASKGQYDAAASPYFFFSPDTARVARPRSGPPELLARIERFTAEKRRLKDELRELIYETDGMLLEYTRTRRLEELAAAQSASLEALEREAEAIRIGLAQLNGYPRYRRPRPLDAGVEERLEAYAEENRSIERARAAYIERRVASPTPTATPAAPSREALYAAVSRHRAAFDLDQSERLMAHDRAAEALYDDLLAVLTPEEAATLNGAPDIAIREFLERRNERTAYAFYDLAALEPGLSPEQRRLLFALGISGLRQVPLPPEWQPTEAPGALFGLGQ